jgi:large subunit ribosomal protein L4e
MSPLIRFGSMEARYMRATVIDLSGNPVSDIELPSVFTEEYRPDLIKRAVLAAQANRRQPYGPHFYAGMNTSAQSWGPGHGVSRVPRIRNGRRAAGIPMAKGGRRSHAPQPEADRSEKINNKERQKAIRSAIAATILPQLVASRGHIFYGSLPIIAHTDLESITKTADVKDFLSVAGVYDDIERAKRGRHIRSGKGKIRGRKYKTPKSVLIVAAEDCKVRLASRNLMGVDFATVKGLNAELLAPGTYAGRLTVWTESAVKSLNEQYPTKQYINYRDNNITNEIRRLFHLEDGMKERDLTRAVSNYRQALDLSSDSMSKPLILARLASTLEDIYQKDKDIISLNESIELYQKAAFLFRDSENLSLVLNNLGHVLRERYLCTHKISDLEEAIESWRKAKNLAADETPSKPISLYNLALGLRDLYELTKDKSKLKEAIKLWSEADILSLKASLNNSRGNNDTLHKDSYYPERF